MNRIKTLGALCALGSIVAAVPASAQCWDDSQLAATRVRDLQTMLMAATLRCRAVGMDISDHYNGFVSARRGQLELANAAIKHRFVKDGGQDSYDRFTTALANAYGDASTTPAACDEAAQTADDAAASPAALFELADQRITPPDAEAGRCARSETIAAAAPAPVAPAIDAAVTPRAAVATMVAATDPAPSAPSPEEVAAAITVLTRYQAVQARLASTPPR
jgi:hypothetical protein